MHVTISSPIPLSTMTPAAATAESDSVASVAASHLDDVSNRPRLAQRAAAFAQGLLERIRSGFASMLDRVGNLLADCLPHKKAADAAPSQPPIDLHAENLAAGANALARVIPKMSLALAAGGPTGRDGDTFAADFRAMRFGLRLLNTAADGLVEKGTLPASVAGDIADLREGIIADNQTQEQLEVRLLKGDLGFLADPTRQTELHDFFRRARDVAVDFATRAGEPELALKLDALCRAQREVS